MSYNIVTLGGGTGTYTLLRGLRHYVPEVTLTAIVTMADSGGSTGRLRDEFGQLPVGDVRMALAALAPTVDRHDEILRELFLYRFDRGAGLAGHNLGNLLLTALTDILGSEMAAIETASRILRVSGDVVPVATEPVHLVATYDDGLTIVGEHLIDEPAKDRHSRRIVKLDLDPFPSLTLQAKEALLKADLVILGPGDLYTSVLATAIVPGVAEALQSFKGKLVYVANLMSRNGQTNGMRVSDYVAEFERYLGRVPDVVLVHEGALPADLVERYQTEEGTHPVEFDVLPDAVEVVRSHLVSYEAIVPRAGDQVKRSFIRHDSDALSACLMNIVRASL